MKKITLSIILILFILVACVPQEGYGTRTVIGENRTAYYFVQDGMPCLVYGSKMSCDWDYWNGRVEDGEIILP